MDKGSAQVEWRLWNSQGWCLKYTISTWIHGQWETWFVGSHLLLPLSSRIGKKAHWQYHTYLEMCGVFFFQQNPHLAFQGLAFHGCCSAFKWLCLKDSESMLSPFVLCFKATVSICGKSIVNQYPQELSVGFAPTIQPSHVCWLSIAPWKSIVLNIPPIRPRRKILMRNRLCWRNTSMFPSIILQSHEKSQEILRHPTILSPKSPCQAHGSSLEAPVLKDGVAYCGVLHAALLGEGPGPAFVRWWALIK